MRLLDKLIGILMPSQLWYKVDEDINKFNYDEIMSQYSGLIENCSYYSGIYYSNPTKENEKFLNEANKLIDDFETKYPWVQQEYNRNL